MPRPRLKPAEVFVIVAVLVISAVIMRNLLPNQESTAEARFQAALRYAMQQFYNTVEVDVHLTNGRDARVILPIPCGSRQRRPEWAYGLGRFVALQHPHVKLNTLSIIDAVTGQPLPSTPAVLGRRDQASLAYQEAAQAELLRRTGQTQLDQAIGPGKTLVLVDAVCQENPTSMSDPGSTAVCDISEDDYPSQNRVEGRPAPQNGDTCEQEVRARRTRVVAIARLEVYVIFSEPSVNDMARTPGLLKTSLHIQPERGDRLSVTALPSAPPDHGVSH